MAKAGRLYVPIDVNWYDEWGHAVSADAALLWILAMGLAKRVKSDTLLLTQLRRVAPTDMTSVAYSNAVSELIGCDIAPISGDELAIVLHGWDVWNDPNRAASSGEYGNHIRWHINAKKPSPTCDYCNDRGDVGATIGATRLEYSRVEYSRERDKPGPKPKRNTQLPEDFAVTDDMRTWAKDHGIKSNLKSETEKFRDHFVAKGDTKKDWIAAWRNWMRRADEYGGFNKGPAAKPESVARGADPMFPSGAEGERQRAEFYGEPIKLPGES